MFGVECSALNVCISDAVCNKIENADCEPVSSSTTSSVTSLKRFVFIVLMRRISIKKEQYRVTVLFLKMVGASGFEPETFCTPREECENSQPHYLHVITC